MRASSEGWPSGRRRQSRKLLNRFHRFRGFESHPLRITRRDRFGRGDSPLYAARMDHEQRLIDLAAAYDARAHDRDERGEPEWRDAMRSDFASRLPAGGRILEIGAGAGHTARWFHDSGFDVIATDLSPGHVERIRAKGVRAYVRDMMDLAFDPGSFDGVWAASCLMHIADAELPLVLTGIHDVLRPGGWFWAGTWGGPDHEGVRDDDTHEPKRFYSFRSDDRIRRVYAEWFDVVSFEAFSVEGHAERHYQSTLMRSSR